MHWMNMMNMDMFRPVLALPEPDVPLPELNGSHLMGGGVLSSYMLLWVLLQLTILQDRHRHIDTAITTR